MPIFPPVKWLAWPPKCRRKADFSPDGPAARPGPDLKDFSLPAISGRRRRRRPFLFGGGAKEEGRMDEGSAGGLGRPGSVSYRWTSLPTFPPENGRLSSGRIPK